MAHVSRTNNLRKVNNVKRFSLWRYRNGALKSQTESMYFGFVCRHYVSRSLRERFGTDFYEVRLSDSGDQM